MTLPPNATVLIVDDNIPAVEMLARLFTGNGYIVHRAHEGKTAIKVAGETMPDLILLDVMMPGMNGYEVLSILRLNDLTAEIPTIFLTAKDAPADIEQGFVLGAVDYIPKPAEPRELLARAKSKIEAKRLREALNKKNRDLEALLRISTALNTALNVRALLVRINELLIDIAPYKTSVAHYMSEGETYIEYRSNHPDFILSEEDKQTTFNHFFDSLRLNGSPTRSTELWEHAFAIHVEIRQDGDIHGVITVLADEELTNDHALFVDGVVRHAALALKNADLYELKSNYAEQLEKTVQKRSDELLAAQQLLIRSEKLASVGRLASAIAHEINNPLTPVVLNLELMVEDLQENRPINTDEVDVLSTYRSAQRIKRILERVLQFTRNGREDKPSLATVDMNTIVSSIVQLSKHYFQQSRVTINFLPSPALPMSLGNSDQLEQVFLNMMLNARDAMESGGELSISTWADEKYVYVQFQDSGIGIPAEMLERLFEPFASTKGENGSGLGLFVSYEIITNHQGVIDVQSKQGEGTTFTIALPVAK